MSDPPDVTSILQPIDSGEKPASEQWLPLEDNAVSDSRWIAGSWCVFAIWVLTASYWLPPTTPESPRMILGMPMWIVLGVFLPWSVATIFTIWFSLAKMTDDPQPETEDD